MLGRIMLGMPKLKYSLAVVGLCILGAIAFGIAHDLVTAHVSVEYFTVYHPRVIESESPVAMALLWGVIATWWMGAFFGIFLSLAATLGERPLLPLRRVCRALCVGLGIVYFLCMLTLVCSYVAVLTVGLDTPNRSAELIAVGATHGLSYFASAILGIVLCIWVWRTRAAIDPHLPAWIDP
jgi:hypothetical protein